MKEPRILIIEDHPLMVEAYQSMFISNEIQAKIVSVNSCKQTFELLKNETPPFDVIILDWSLPKYDEENISNGGDLVPLIKRHSPSGKLIVFTSHVEAFLLSSIIREINPNALLFKGDFINADFQNLWRALLIDEKIYSKTVLEQINLLKSNAGYLDNFDRQIIILLSKGVQTKNLPQYLPLSISTIDKRKAQIKDYLLLNKGTDEDIIRVAKQTGLI